jgi:hypothetical protein
MLRKHGFSRVADAVPGIGVIQAEEMILEALEPTIAGLHWVGHNVIYSALSLLAIRQLGGWGTHDDIKGITALIRSFEKTIPGRSWLGYSASEVKRLELSESDEFPVIDSAERLSAFILQEVSEFKLIYRAEAHNDLIGHMLTYSHALNILHDLGHESYFRRGLTPLLKLVKALRFSRDLKPDDSVKLISPVDHLPLARSERAPWLPIEPEFWSKDHSDTEWEFGHQFKFAFSYFNHLSRAPQYKESTIENFRYIITF